MNYTDDAFSYFEHPDFVNRQKDLFKRNSMMKNLMRENDAFNIDNVFDADKHLEKQELPPVPNLDGKHWFSAFGANNPVPESISDTAAKTDTAAASNFLGTKGVGVPGAIAEFGMEGIKDFSSVSSSDGEAISNGLNLTMKGAQAGMAVAGPYGAAVGAGVGLVAGVYDGFADAGARGNEERKANKKLQEKEHTQLEQEQRQKDGLSSLENLTALRKQQERFIV